MERINTILGVKLLLVWIFAASLLGACATAPEPATSTAVGDSGSREVRQLLATAYRSMTKRDEVAAEAALLEARRLDPKNPWIALNLGVINHWRGKNDLARTEYKAALAFERVDNAAVVSDGALNGASVGSLSRHNLALLDKNEGREAVPAAPAKRTAPQTRTDGKISPSVVESKPGDTRTELLALLGAWRTSWADGDIEAYLACYTPSFHGDKPDRRALEENRRRFVAGKRGIDIGLEDISVLIEGGKATLTFVQRYRSPSFSDVGSKKLSFERIGGQWLIVREVFSAKI